MGIIYLITNDLNDKKYVGLTTRDLEFRWKEHCRHSSQSIDSAITKYGKHHFHISILEDCPEDKLDEREQYWIKYYDSFNNGYNLTNGGRGSNFIKNPDKVKEVKELWDLGHGQKSITKLTKLNVETVHSYLLKSGVTKEDIKDFETLLKIKTIKVEDKEGKLVDFSDAAKKHLVERVTELSKYWIARNSK